jgi:hypothetical protein
LQDAITKLQKSLRSPNPIHPIKQWKLSIVIDLILDSNIEALLIKNDFTLTSYIWMFKICFNVFL